MLNKQSTQGGFTSVELMVVVAMVSILTFTGAQQYLSTLGAFTRMTAISKFQSDVQRARTESIAQGGRGIMIPALTGAGYQMGIDYWPFGSSVAIEKQLFTTDFGNEVGFEASGPIIFNSRGFLVDDAGAPTTITMSFTFRGGQYCAGELYSSGVLEMSCR